MRKPCPIVSDLKEIVVKREGHYATIEYKDPDYGKSHLEIGPDISQMTDEEIMEMYNAILRSLSERRAMNPYVAKEVPLNSPQITYSESDDQWVPRGEVLRCFIDEAEDEEGEWEPMIDVDGKALSWEAFGKLIKIFAGWGMRIEFVPDDALHRRPNLLVQEKE